LWEVFYNFHCTGTIVGNVVENFVAPVDKFDTMAFVGNFVAPVGKFGIMVGNLGVTMCNFGKKD
jgi:hypothetical protein